MEDYKEKYEGLMKNIEHLHKSVNTEWKRIIECYIPELKESDDEKIRKEMIEILRKEAQEFPSSVIAEKSNSWIAWLEKQGEQRLINKVEPKFKVGDTIRLKGTLTEYTIESISGECYHGKGWGLLTSYDDDYELVEQKPTWSEEDEHCIELLLPIIDSSSLIPKNRKKCKKFLKSLKERVQPQPNQEWSEEEKARIDKIIDVLDWAEEKGRISYSDWEDYVCYVKSLKPQSTWKPSNEQMKGIECAIKTLQHQLNVGDKRLDSLYDDLKKLREE